MINPKTVLSISSLFLHCCAPVLQNMKTRGDKKTISTVNGNQMFTVLLQHDSFGILMWFHFKVCSYTSRNPKRRWASVSLSCCGWCGRCFVTRITTRGSAVPFCTGSLMLNEKHTKQCFDGGVSLELLLIKGSSSPANFPEIEWRPPFNYRQSFFTGDQMVTLFECPVFQVTYKFLDWCSATWF
jgi:hypothetical protein